MDLGFSKSWKWQGDGPGVRTASTAAELARLLAASAARQGATPTALSLASSSCGGMKARDPIQALAHIMAPGVREEIDLAAMGGSFCPATAARLTVGQEA